LKHRRGDREAAAAKALLDWAKKNGLRVWWGKGTRDGSFAPMLDHKGEKHFVTIVRTDGRVEVSFGRMLTRRPFDDEAKRRELRDRLNRIPGIDIPADAITLYPTIPVSALTDATAAETFLAALDWYFAAVKSA
jgi:hypothetical protein